MDNDNYGEEEYRAGNDDFYNDDEEDDFYDDDEEDDEDQLREYEEWEQISQGLKGGGLQLSDLLRERQGDCLSPGCRYAADVLCDICSTPRCPLHSWNVWYVRTEQNMPLVNPQRIMCREHTQGTIASILERQPEDRAGPDGHLTVTHRGSGTVLLQNVRLYQGH